MDNVRTLILEKNNKVGYIMWPFARKETESEIIERIFKLTDQKDYGICSSPMSAQVAINELASHFLGEDWYSTSFGNAEQINTEIVTRIETMYPKKVKCRAN